MRAKADGSSPARDVVEHRGVRSGMHMHMWTSLNGRLTVLLASVLCAMFLFGACAVTHEPERWSRSVHEMPTNVYGSWVWVTIEKTAQSKKAESFGGELIAVSTDSLYVASPVLRVLPRSAIANVRLAAYDPYFAGVFGLALLGSLTTISNGWYLMLTWPMWWFGGAIAAGSRSYTPVDDYTTSTCGAMYPFSRFPAGFPEGIDRNAIIMPNDRRGLHAY